MNGNDCLCAFCLPLTYIVSCGQPMFEERVWILFKLPPPPPQDVFVCVVLCKLFGMLLGVCVCVFVLGMCACY